MSDAVAVFDWIAMLIAEAAFGTQAQIGECPVWDATHGDLLWVDVMPGLIHRRALGSGKMKSISVGRPVGRIALTESGPILAAVQGGFCLVSADGDIRYVATVEAAHPEMRMNDGHCDHRGR